MKLIAVITPTYNRAKLLPRLFESLKNQESANFNWYIIDDGSTDNTEELVKSFKSDNFDINYIKKENGGKHTALNTAMQKVLEELSFIVDSDDYLTSNAIKVIEEDYNLISNNNDICGIGYLRCYNDMSVVGKEYTQNGITESFISQRINKNIYGDKAEVFKTEILKNYPFPVFEKENFVSESTVWCDIALKYKMMFFNKKIYICEYQADGLSSGVHKRLFNNPNGSVACYLKMSTKPFKLKYKIKYTIAFSMYAFRAKIKVKKQYKMANSKFIYICTFPVAFMFYKLRQKRYAN